MIDCQSISHHTHVLTTMEVIIKTTTGGRCNQSQLVSVLQCAISDGVYYFHYY